MTGQRDGAVALIHRWQLWRADLEVAVNRLNVTPLTDEEWAELCGPQ